MKWKITLRFMLAVLAVSIMSSIANAFISMYFSYERYTTEQVFSGIFAVGTFSGSNATNPTAPDMDDVYVTVQTDGSSIALNDIDMQGEILRFTMQDKDSGQALTITSNIVESITEGNGWLQVINSSGKEIGSINKPDGVKAYYTTSEIERASITPLKVEKYYVRTIPERSADGTNRNGKMTYVIGIPQPEFNWEAMVNYNMDYFRALDAQKIVSLITTLVISLVLGYLLAARLNRPVVKMTDGIMAMAGGDYDVEFPKDSFYRDVYKSLTHMAASLKAGELERKKTEKNREEWITNISHDLKTPLSSIKGYGELLYESGHELAPEDLKKYIAVVLEKSAYMDVLINDLKLTQMLKNEAFPLNKETGNLVELLRETVIGILNDPRFEGRRLHFEPECEDVRLKFDAHLFKRAFTNLVMNAVAHNAENTEIWVRIRQDDGIMAEISDNGNGIEKAEQEKLFERYYRGTSTNDSYDGSGLGLAIAREIIQAHGGRIDLESKVGEGTTVRVWFQ
jgi:signal transduction histidine kinase